MALASLKVKKEKFPSYEEFLKATKSKTFAPIYLFFGEEAFLIDECVNYIIRSLLTNDSKAFNLDIVYGSKTNIKDVLAHAASYPLMSEKRVVVVKEFEKLVSNETSKELFSAYINKPLESTCLILIAESVDFRARPYNELKKLGIVFSFNRLYDNQIPVWITTRCKQLGKVINTDASRLIQAYIGNSLRDIQNELDKLFAYLGERDNITVEDVANVVGASRGFTVFDLQNAIGLQDLEKALCIINKMLEKGEQPQLIIIMLTRYFTTIWKILELSKRNANRSEILAFTGVSSYYLNNYLETAKSIHNEGIEKAFCILRDADIKLKTTTCNLQNLMEMMVYSLVNVFKNGEGDSI